MKIPHIFILVGYDLSIFEWQLRINLPYKGRLQKTRWKFKIIFSIKRRIPRPNGYNFHPFFTPLFFLFSIESYILISLCRAGIFVERYPPLLPGVIIVSYHRRWFIAGCLEVRAGCLEVSCAGRHEVPGNRIFDRTFWNSFCRWSTPAGHFPCFEHPSNLDNDFSASHRSGQRNIWIIKSMQNLNRNARWLSEKKNPFRRRSQ